MVAAVVLVVALVEAGGGAVHGGGGLLTCDDVCDVFDVLEVPFLVTVTQLLE